MESHQILNFFCSAYASTKVVVAEWLRRWTRNPLGSPRAGSNPADYGVTFFLISLDVIVSTTHYKERE